MAPGPSRYHSASSASKDRRWMSIDVVENGPTTVFEAKEYIFEPDFS